MMKNMLTRGITVFLAIGLLTGCQLLQTREATEGFEENLMDYGASLRWGHFNTAISYMRDPDGTPRQTNGEFNPDLRVVSYRVKSRTIIQLGKEILVDAEIGYFATDSGMVMTIDDRQNWWYDGELKRWFLDGEIPEVLLKR